MTSRSFVPWVEPIAAKLREGRREIAEAARAVPVEAWARPSPSSGWTYRDLLVHLAVGDWVCQTVLRAAVANERLDVAATFGSVDVGNERLRRERTTRSVEELIAEVEAEGEETQGLLAELTDADESRSEEDAPMNLGEYLREFPGHDRSHLEELRTALP